MTGWVIEYPGKSTDGPADFFESKRSARKFKWMKESKEKQLKASLESTEKAR
jgi:hypothetical protein